MSFDTLQTLCLTPDQIADLLIADDPTTLSLASRRRHLSECAACLAEFNLLQGAVQGLRDSAHRSAEAFHADVVQQMRATRNASIVPKRSAPTHRAVWAVAVAAVALVAALPLAHRAATGSHVTTAIAPAQNISSSPATGTPATDEALLNDINEDLSASVPTSLEPLAATSSSSSAGTTSDGSQALP